MRRQPIRRAPSPVRRAPAPDYDYYDAAIRHERAARMRSQIVQSSRNPVYEVAPEHRDPYFRVRSRSPMLRSYNGPVMRRSISPQLRPSALRYALPPRRRSPSPPPAQHDWLPRQAHIPPSHSARHEPYRR